MISMRFSFRAGRALPQASNTMAADRVPSLRGYFLASAYGTLCRRSGNALAQDSDGLRSAELLDIERLDAVVLHPDRPRLGSFAVGSDADVALDRVERVRVHAFGKLVVVEGSRCGNRVTGGSAISYRRRASDVYEIAV